jgi:HSP20 family molecular chaperone IbpA
MSSLFGHQFHNHPEPNFRGLFRLLEDFDRYSSVDNATQRPGRQTPVFTPKFDLKETANGYELHGELPGIERDRVNIEFSDPQTIVIRGEVERSYSSGTPPASIEGVNRGAIAGTEQQQQSSTPEKSGAESHQATVQNGAAETSSEVASRPKQSDVEAHKSSGGKFWVSERSIGHFSRTFHFPTLVDTAAVSASLKDGILSVTVPKAKKPETKRITIS